MAGIGVPELIIVLVILLVIFGPKRLPGAGKALGTGMREFKDSISGKGGRDDDSDDDAAEPRPALTPGVTSPAAVAEDGPASTAPEEVERSAGISEPRA
jgi:sec-independent protein translocase protein TatA